MKHVNTVLKIANHKTINKLIINLTLVEKLLKRIESVAQQVTFEFPLKNIKIFNAFQFKGKAIEYFFPW
jgi:hypothetical protein